MPTKREILKTVRQHFSPKERKQLGLHSKATKKQIIQILSQLRANGDERLVGSGWFDWLRPITDPVKNLFKPRKEYNNTSQRTLRQYGHYVIHGLVILRTPITGALNHALELASLGKWNKIKKEANYDKLFHLSLLANLKTTTGKVFQVIIEKNEVVNVSTNFRLSKNTETYNLPAPKGDVKLGEFLNRGMDAVGRDQFFLYDAFKGKNCQNFIMDLLKANGVLTQGAMNFIFQPMTQIVQKLPGYIPDMARFFTDIAATWNKLSGQGKAQGETTGLMRSLKAYALGDNDIKDDLPSTKIWTYYDLQKAKSLDELWDKKGRFILLYPLEKRNVGHWVCLLKRDDGTIEFFDSYGEKPDQPIQELTAGKRNELDLEKEVLMDLLKQSGAKIVYNSHPFQKLKPGINTCGRWCVSRLAFHKMPLNDFKKLIDDMEIEPDKAVVALTEDVPDV